MINDKIREALERQCDNMAFIINHCDLGELSDKFVAELNVDREALSLDLWQPIETASKDGVRVITYSNEICSNCSPDASGMAVARFIEGRDWVCGKLQDGEFIHLKHPPTHWQPLPEPPKKG